MNDPFEENPDLLRAFEDRPPRGDKALPAHILARLELERRRWLPVKRPAPWLRVAAAVTLLGGLSWWLLPSGVSVARVVITSPGDVIRNGQPTLAWTSKDPPGQKYDVWLLPPDGDPLTVPALMKAERVTSPVAFSQLSGAQASLAAGRYRLLVCLASQGRSAGVAVPFEVR